MGFDIGNLCGVKGKGAVAFSLDFVCIWGVEPVFWGLKVPLNSWEIHPRWQESSGRWPHVDTSPGLLCWMSGNRMDCQIYRCSFKTVVMNNSSNSTLKDLQGLWAEGEHYASDWPWNRRSSLMLLQISLRRHMHNRTLILFNSHDPSWVDTASKKNTLHGFRRKINKKLSTCNLALEKIRIRSRPCFGLAKKEWPFFLFSVFLF